MVYAESLGSLQLPCINLELECVLTGNTIVGRMRDTFTQRTQVIDKYGTAKNLRTRMLPSSRSISRSKQSGDIKHVESI